MPPILVATYSRLKVYQDCPWDIPCVVALVVEDILSVTALGRKVLEIAILVDPMFLAELLPELTPNCRQGCQLLIS